MVMVVLKLLRDFLIISIFVAVAGCQGEFDPIYDGSFHRFLQAVGVVWFVAGIMFLPVDSLIDDDIVHVFLALPASIVIFVIGCLVEFSM